MMISGDLFKYPEWLEHWWVDEYLGHHVSSRSALPRGYEVKPVSEGLPRLVEGKNLTILRQRVDFLSDLFTTERVAGFGQYARDRKMLLAYGLFYFPQTFIRTRLVMTELLRRWSPAGPKVSILDMGAGTGAAGLAAAEILAQYVPPGGNVHLHSLDDSIASMRLLQELVAGTRAQWKAPSLQTSVADFSAPRALASRMRGKKYDLVIASFVMNEIFQRASAKEAFEWVVEFIQMLGPTGVMVIMEPALKLTSEKLWAVRDLLAQDGYLIHAPCPHQLACPLLAEGKYHCHEVRAWTPPPSLEMINRKLLRSAGKTLKFSFLVVGQKQTPLAAAPGHVFRLVSPWVRAKGKWLAAGCNHLGQKAEYEIQSRDLPERPEKQFARMERGDIISIKDDEVERKGQIYRIKGVEEMSVWRPD